MNILKRQYIKGNKGKPIGVLLPIAEYQALIERIEELEDIIAYDKAKRKPSDPISFESFLKELENSTHSFNERNSPYQHKH